MRLRWGILSTARINRRLIAAVRASEGSEIVAVASRDANRARSYATEWDIPCSYGSYPELLADGAVDVIYNPLPNHLHAPWSVRALKAGKHVLCEKPLALSSAQVDVMTRAAKASGRVLAEAFMYRHHPRTIRVRQLIRDGAIGDLRLARGAFTFRYGQPGKNYRMDPDQGGGSLWDVGCYPVSFMRYVIAQEPESVEGHRVDGSTGVDMAFAGTLQFPGGILGSFDCGFDAAFRSEMTFVGTEGVLEVPMAFRAGQDAEIVIKREAGEERLSVPGDEPRFLDEVRDMERAVTGGEAQEIPLAESRGNAVTLSALLESARTGRAECIDG